MPRRIALIATSLALVVVLAACGSDDDSADERDTTTTTEEEETSTTEADDPDTEDTAEPDDTTGSTEPTDTTEAPEDPPDTIEIPEGADFCAAYAAFDETADELPSDTVEDVQTGTVLLRDGIAQLAPLAPEELTEQMALLVQATEELVDAAADATTVEEAEAALGEIFSNTEFSDAAEAIDDHFDQSCEEANDEQAPADDGAQAPETVTPG
ncbi:MAG TPA: hypothetical protein VFU19_21405 [Iamia sp.]|nr:hypothetical protein [Iamia sp.]